LGGLEVSLVNASDLEFSGRIDSEYYRPSFLQASQRLEDQGAIKLGADASFLIGPFGSAFAVENYEQESGFRYIRGKDVKPLTLMDNDNMYMPEADFRRLAKYELRKDDVLVSVVGTLGNAALVTPKDLPAVFSCKSTAIRPVSVLPTYLVIFLNCRYGRDLLIRMARGAVQQGLNLDDLKDLSVFLPTDDFQRKMDAIFRTSLALVENSKIRQLEGEGILLASLGLSNWKPPEPLTYSAFSSSAFVSGRLDAQFFAPRIRQLLDHLSGAGTSIASVCTSRREKFNPAKHGDFDYIEISDLDGTGTTSSSGVAAEDAASRATWFVRPGDVITSTVRPIRRLSAQIMPDQDGHVCSSGFVVLSPTGVSSELLLTYLRLPVICELMDLYASASMYPAISETDLLALPFPAVDARTDSAVVLAVQEGRNARNRALALLDAAKRAVEIAIEDSEAAAIAYLDTVGA
jgi:hypothetical protein